MKAKKIVAIMLALVMVLALGTTALAATGDMSNPVTAADLNLYFGDPDYPATAPECYMYFKETGTNTYDAIYSTNGTTASTSFYPSILAFYVIPVKGANGQPVTTVTSITGTDMDFVTYDEETGAETVSTTVTVNEKGFYTIKPKSNSSKIVINGTVTVNFSAPLSAIAAAGAIAKDICGFLPVGQFARYNSFGWGTIFTDNTNVYDSTKQAKFVSSTGTGTSYVSTGVSLGMAGGYVQFDMGTETVNGKVVDRQITNDPTNPYGIDFVVYGNAFVGNPEAGIVKVSQDGVKWYTLAGSRHYMTGTKWNQNISYIKITTAGATISGKTFSAAGIYCSTDFDAPSSDNADAVNAAIGEATWTGIPQLTGNTYPKTYSTATPAAAAWWPEWEKDSGNHDENYGQVWKINGDTDLSDVSWLRSGSAEVITYKNVTTVEDDMVVLNRTLSAAPSQAQMTDVYQWGYSDVRPNGSEYGTILNNPYAAAPSTQTGGDGFDLSWAVDDNGVPVKLEGVRYVRVYSGVLFNAGIFGETSTEVCGLYVTSNKISAGAGTTAAPTITVAGQTITLDMLESKGNDVFYFNAFGGAMPSDIAVTATAASSTAKVFINGSSTNTFTTQSTTRGVQILVQDGNSAPFILVVR